MYTVNDFGGIKMIFDIILFICLLGLAYQTYLTNKKVKELSNKKCGCNNTKSKKDPYKDWRDPSTGLLKSRKNTMI